MTKLFVFGVLAMVLMSGCSGTRCDKVRPYQRTVAGQPIQVPGDLSQPAMRSRAPEIEPDAVTQRSDGRCLEDPPAYVPEDDDGQESESG